MVANNNSSFLRRGHPALVLIAALLSLCGVGCGEKETVVDTASSSQTAQTGKFEKRICPKCGRQYFNGENYCLYDRTQLVAASTLKATEKVCPVCGRKYPPSKNFCVFDGAALVDVTPQEGTTVAKATDTQSHEGGAASESAIGEREGASHSASSGSNTGSHSLSTREEKSSTSHDTRVASREPVATTTHSRSGSGEGISSSRTTHRKTRETSTETTSYGSSWRQPTPRPYRYVPPPTPRPTRYVPQPTPRPTRYVPPPTPIPVKVTPVPPPPPPLPVATPAPVAVAKVEPPASTESKPVMPARSATELFDDFEATSTKASQGKLSASDVSALEAVGMSDPNFTRSRALLAMNYKHRDNEKYYKALTELMSLPENKYNPMYNLELAEYYLLSKKYAKSVQQAKMVDRFKQRLPRSVYYQSVARLYEVQAKAYEGRFNETEDPEYLDKAISVWKRYITHVSKRDDTEKVKMAQDYIAKLEKIKRRLE